MTRYYFDVRVGDHLDLDDEGTELDGLAQVQSEASLALGEMARDDLRKAPAQNYYRKTVEVRDANGPVMEARYTFELQKK